MSDGTGPRLRAQLIELATEIELGCDGVHAAIWLRGTDLVSHSVGERDRAATTAPLCSVPIRGSKGELLGAVTVSSSRQPGLTLEGRDVVESAARVAGLMVENARAGEYGALLDRVPAIIYIADPGETGRWHYVSPQIDSILGFSVEEWLADPRLWSAQIHPHDREAVLIGESNRSISGAADPGASEYRMLHRDGHAVWIRDDARLLLDEVGRLRWHGVLSDITDRKEAEAELERRARQQAAVARLGEHALERAAIDDLIEEAISAAAEILGVESAMVGELVAGGDELQTRAATGWPRSELGQRRTRLGRASQAGYTLLTGAPVVVEDWAAETRYAPSAPFREQGVRSGVSVQIEGEDGPWGVFGVVSTRPRTYPPGDVDFVQSLANVLADALERQRVEEAIQHRAVHDPLTGLPNRVLFRDRLEQSLERLRRHPGIGSAVLFLDLDHFKLVNDSLGHPAGDELLAAVANRLRQAMRPTDTVARFGGDEFGLILEEVANERDAVAMAERIAGVFARPFVLEASEHFVTTSIGIALAAGGERPEDLIRDADAAMYRAKERGRARYELFDEIMRARAIARLRIENDLRRAIERDELHLAYQPVVALRDESIVGVEALIRWQHPTRGLVGPDEFIPVAEENGLIERIGRWVLEVACRDAAGWARLRPDAPPLGISVNLSPLQLVSGTFPETLARVLRSTGLAPESLSLEVTETLLLEEADSISEAFNALKAIGVKLVLDDFGTGYSSLSYLTRLPIDVLKVDRSFVGALGTSTTDSAITEAIVAMARALSLEVVGEGTETPEQVLELRRLGCDYAQGHLFSEPVSARAIAQMLAGSAFLRRTTAARRPDRQVDRPS